MALGASGHGTRVAPAEPTVFEPAVSATVPEALAFVPEMPMPMNVAPDVLVAAPEAPAIAAPEAPMQIDVAPEAPAFIQCFIQCFFLKNGFGKAHMLTFQRRNLLVEKKHVSLIYHATLLA